MKGPISHLLLIISILFVNYCNIVKAKLTFEDAAKLAGFKYVDSENMFNVTVSCKRANSQLCDEVSTIVEEVTSGYSKIIEFVNPINFLIEIDTFEESKNQNVIGFTVPLFVRGQKAVKGEIEHVPQALARQAKFESFYTNFRFFEQDFVIKMNSTFPWFKSSSSYNKINKSEVDIKGFLSRQIVKGLGWYSSYQPCDNKDLPKSCIVRRSYRSGTEEHNSIVGFTPLTSFDMLLARYVNKEIVPIDRKLEKEFAKAVYSGDKINPDLLEKGLSNLPTTTSIMISQPGDYLDSYNLTISNMAGITFFYPQTSTLMSFNLKGVTAPTMARYIVNSANSQKKFSVHNQSHFNEALRTHSRSGVLRSQDIISKLPLIDPATYAVLNAMGYNDNTLTFRSPFVADGSDGFDQMQ